MKNIVKSAIFGVVVGDALGVPVEFTPRVDRDIDPVTGMIAYGTHSQPAGTWSDDSSMMLATMDSIILRRRFDPDDVMQKFADWLIKGDYTPYGKAFDVGTTCSKAITEFLHGTEPYKCGGKTEKDNGNGSLMRIMPGSLCCAASEEYWDEEKIGEASDFIHGLSGLTHGHPRSLMGCLIYTSICHELILGKDEPLEDRIQDAVGRTLEFYDHAWEKYSWFDEDFCVEIRNDAYVRLRNINEFKNLPRETIQSGGYVVHTLEAAVWCLLNTNSFPECVLAAVNLGDDTDTVGAVAGGLAGLLYGYNAIPEAWLKVIAKREWIEALCDDYANYLETKAVPNC